MDLATNGSGETAAPLSHARAAADQGRWTLALTTLALSTAAVVVLAYALHAARLIAYPWDWSPDEGLYLDQARRLLEDPASLYAKRVAPAPAFHGPLLPALLAPLVRLPQPFLAARCLALLWTLAGAGAVALLTRRQAGTLWAALAAALYLAPLDLSFWHMLVRVDGPMITLWLWTAVALLPGGLSRGADVLSTRRLLAGVALTIASALVKPTAIVHAAPVFLGWFLVDRRSAWRLARGVAVAGLVTVAALQTLTSGGFLWVNRLWSLHSRVDGQATALLMRFFVLAWPVLGLAVVLLLAGRVSGLRPLRNPVLLVVAGGLAAAPLLGKQGASWNYLIPLYAGIVLVACTCFGSAARPGRGIWRRFLPPAALVASAAVALGLVTFRRFPTPTRLDERTARAFYAFTEEVQRRAGGPFLVARPDLVYFLASQPVEMEGTSFQHLDIAGVPGTEDVLRRLQAQQYTMVGETWRLPRKPAWTGALRAWYRHVGGCRLGWYFGSSVTHLHLRSDLSIAFAPPSGTRCAPAAPGSLPEAELYP